MPIRPDRALQSSLRDRRIRVLTPEDFVVFELLSSRERDLDDARSVVEHLASELELASIESEVRILAAALPDVPVRDRWRSLDPPLR